MKSLYIIAATLLLSAVSPASLAQSRVIELSYEISPSLVRMPDSDNGELTAQSCATCKVLRLRASPDTRYTIGNQLVTRAEMTRFLAGNPVAVVVVMQLKGTSELTRIVVNTSQHVQ